MSVGTALEIWSSESEASLTDGFKTFEFSPIRVFQFTCSADATDVELYGASGLPAGGSAHPGAPFVFAETARIRRISPILAECTVRYKGKTPANDQGGDPTSQNAYVESWSDVEVEEEIDVDFDGKPILTAALEPVVGIKAVFCDQVATIRRNIPLGSYNPYTAAVYRRSVNSDTFLGWPPGTAKIMKLGVRSVNQSYYDMTAQVQFRIPYLTTSAKAWYSRWRHEGFYHYVDVVIDGETYKKIVRAVDDNNKPTTKKVLLDADGYRVPGQIAFANLAAFPATGDKKKNYLAEDTGKTYLWDGTTYNEVTPASVSPVWKETKRYGSQSFSALFGSTIIN
jgi:hypothetical protein